MPNARLTLSGRLTVSVVGYCNIALNWVAYTPLHVCLRLFVNYEHYSASSFIRICVPHRCIENGLLIERKWSAIFHFIHHFVWRWMLLVADIHRIHKLDGRMLVESTNKAHCTEDQSQGVLRERSNANCHHMMLIHVNGVESPLNDDFLFSVACEYIEFSSWCFGDECMTGACRPLLRKKTGLFLEFEFGSEMYVSGVYRDEYTMCAMVCGVRARFRSTEYYVMILFHAIHDCT